MARAFQPKLARGPSDPPFSHVLIVPKTPTDPNRFLDPRPDALFIGADGNVAIEDEEGVVITYPVKASQILPFSGVAVVTTDGTTVTTEGLKIIGWW